jgi:hyperosmotically inducible periplasmic protein
MKKLTAFLSMIVPVVFLASACTATKNTGVAVGSGTKEAAQQVGDAATDASITAAVKMKMADDPVVAAMKIDVDTTDGNVTLTGSVKSKAEADQAVKIAKSVDGVKSVQSKLVVSS